MTTPLTEQQLTAIDEAITAYQGHAPIGFACCTAHPVADHGAALLAEVRRLQTELAEMRAARDVIASLHRDLDARLDAVTALCDREQRNAGRWETPLPVPEWVEAVREAAARPVEETHVVADSSADPEHVDDCPGCTPV